MNDTRRARPVTPMLYGAPNAVAAEVLYRAEKRLRSHIAAHGIDARALEIAARAERAYASVAVTR